MSEKRAKINGGGHVKECQGIMEQPYFSGHQADPSPVEIHANLL